VVIEIAAHSQALSLCRGQPARVMLNRDDLVSFLDEGCATLSSHPFEIRPPKSPPPRDGGCFVADDPTSDAITFCPALGRCCCCTFSPPPGRAGELLRDGLLYCRPAGGRAGRSPL
jgi:hypothetical protein